jgi:hypothetical protein
MLGGAAIIGSAQTSPWIVVFLATFIGFNYGAALAIFPSFAKDLWGARNFGSNYGLLFTAWGISGFVLSRVSEAMVVQSGSFASVFVMAAALLVLGAALGWKIDDHKFTARREARRLTALAPGAAVVGSA